MELSAILDAISQRGMIGLVAVLLAIQVWLIHRLLTILSETNEIIRQNATALDANQRMGQILTDLIRALYEKIISRPCIAKGE